jgi:hypothetical protein
MDVLNADAVCAVLGTAVLQCLTKVAHEDVLTYMNRQRTACTWDHVDSGPTVFWSSIHFTKHHGLNIFRSGELSAPCQY